MDVVNLSLVVYTSPLQFTCRITGTKLVSKQHGSLISKEDRCCSTETAKCNPGFFSINSNLHSLKRRSVLHASGFGQHFGIHPFARAPLRPSNDCEHWVLLPLIFHSFNPSTGDSSAHRNRYRSSTRHRCSSPGQIVWAAGWPKR